MKKKFIFLLALAIICCLALTACSEGDSPVESIVVTDMPVTDYYLGDAFILNNASITAYYENGKVVTVKIDPSMISAFNSQSLGEQYLTVLYGGVATYIKVNVALPPIYSLEVAEGNYKKTYVQGQALDVTGMNLTVTYTNGYVTSVPVTADMVEGFDSSMPGEKQLAIVYGDATARCYVSVVGRSISNIGIETPNKLSYVVGDEINFAGGRIFVSYNNNTQGYVNIDDALLNNPNFKVYISGEETRTFTEAGTPIYVTLSYYGHTVDFIVRVEEVKAKKIEWVQTPKKQPRNSAKPDFSGAKIKVTYNNTYNPDDAEILNLSDARIKWDTSTGSGTDNSTETKVEIDLQGFDITKTGIYPIVIKCGGASIDYDLEVIEPVEQELIIFTHDSEYYQDGPDIDITKWSYSIKMSNGLYRGLNSDGAEEVYFRRDGSGALIDNGLFVGAISSYDFTTSKAGERTYQFRYRSVDGSVNLTTDVTINVYARLIVGVAAFTEPTKKVYVQEEELSLVGGSFRPVYNDGTQGETTAITSDMLTESIAAYTALTGTRTVGIRYTDAKYAGAVDMQYTVSVIKRADRITYNAPLSDGLKTEYILGESFNRNYLVVVVEYSDDTTSTFTEFGGREWTFVNTTFDAVGDANVYLYFGDYSGGANNVLFTTIPVRVTNDITDIVFADDFENFGSVVEGLEIDIPNNAILNITRQNGAQEQVRITADMIDYSSINYTIGEREVIVSYEGHSLVSSVNVIKRSISSIEVVDMPTVLSYTIADTEWALSGLRVKVNYNNNTTLYINGNDVIYDSLYDEYDRYSVTVAGRELYLALPQWQATLPAGEKYAPIDVVLTVSDQTADSTSYEGASYTVYLFEQLVEELIFGTDADGDGAVVEICETEALELPTDSYIKIIYVGGGEETVYLSGRSDYSISGYDAYSAGIQSVSINFLLTECSVTVDVKGKVLQDVSVVPSYVTVTEGMPITADAINVRLHFVKYDGSEYSPVYYANVDFGNISSCSYDKDTPVIFDDVENNVRFTEQEHNVHYVYKGVDKVANFTLRINQKVAVKLTMQTMPRRTYTELETEIDLDGGKVLVTYNNGTGEQLDLSSALVTVSPVSMPNAQIEYGETDRQQKITVSFRDGNNIEVSTYYDVTIKDRHYLRIEYATNPLDDVYLVEYGSTSDSRPEFGIFGYVLRAGAVTEEELASGDDIDGKEGFELYYLTEAGVCMNAWPTQVGYYTLVITYTGDDYNNAYIEESRLIRIYPKQLALCAIDKQVTYGTGYDAGEAGYEWTVKDAAERVGNAALEWGDLMDSIFSVSFGIYDTFTGDPVSFYTTQGGRTVYASTVIGSAVVGDYELRPSISSSLSANYTFTTFTSATLTVQKMDIKLAATAMQKTYGDVEPTYNQYTVYTVSDVQIGTNGSISLDGGNYVDSITTYYLSRVEGENVGTYEILKSDDRFIPNYNLTAANYQSALLTINKKPITISGSQIADRYYGQAAPVDSSEYGYALNASSMANGDRFATVFDFLLDYRTGIAGVEDNNNIIIKQISVRILRKSDSYDMDCSVLSAVAGAGTYTVKTSIVKGADNYDVTIEDFDFVINKTSIDVLINSTVIEYMAFAEGNAYDDGIEVGRVYNGNGYDDVYEITYPSYYSIVTEPVFTVIKNVGTDVGKYRLWIPQASIDSYPDYIVNVIGAFGELYEDYADSYGFIRDISEAVYNGSYLVIQPSFFSYETATSEIYARKVSVKPDITATYDQEDVKSAVYNAFNFTLTNQTSSRANIGYYAADTYDVAATYNYFSATVSSRNFIPNTSLLYYTDEWIIAVFDYIFNGTEHDILLRLDSFEYEIEPKDVTINVINGDDGYTGEQKAVVLSEYDEYLCAGDSLHIGYYIEVKFYGREEYVETDSILNAGDYKVRISGISNTDYNLEGNELCEFTIGTKVLDVVMTDADENDFIHTLYTGAAISTSNMNWQTVNNGNPTDGYFTANNNKIKVVNDAGVTRTAISALSINPYVDDGNGNYVSPVNANSRDEYDNIIPYEYRFIVNDTHVNMSVRFVKPNPSYDSTDPTSEQYIPTSYGFVIDPKEVTLQCLTLRKCNVKDYDGRDPEIKNRSAIIVQNDVNADKVDVSNLVFSFRRDTSTIPVELQSVVNDSDLSMAGRFIISVAYVKGGVRSYNYTFRLLGDDQYYTINRLHVQLSLNSVSGSTITYLNKQFDTIAPDTVMSSVPRTQSFAIADEVNIELNTKYFTSAHSYGVNSSWSSYNSAGGNGIGYYAYDFKTYTMVDANKIYFDDVINDRGYSLLSWNYTYSITAAGSVDTNSCDGVYQVLPKDISLCIDGAADETLLESDSPTVYYVYTKTYSSSSVTASSAQTTLNGYTVKDAGGNTLSASALAELGFDHTIDVAVSGSDITNVGQHFLADISALVAGNPNFHITNNPLAYQIGHLTVDLTLRFHNTNDDEEMTYGTVIMKAGSGITYDEIDFYDVEAFQTALGLSNQTIGMWLTTNQVETDKFVVRNAIYTLTRKGNNGVTYNLNNQEILNAGEYVAGVTGIISLNFNFRIHGADFTINPKVINLSGAERDYFDMETLDIDYSIDTPVNQVTERNIITAVVGAFTDNTHTNSDSGAYLFGDEKYGSYFIYATRSYLDSVMRNYGNYTLVIDEITPTDYDANNVYLALNINKLTVTAALRNAEQADIRVTYGHVLSAQEYQFVITGFPTLTTGQSYDYSTELDKQAAVKTTIATSVLDMEAIIAYIASVNARTNAYSVNLTSYLIGSTILDNYFVQFAECSFSVDKIDLIFEINRSGSFRILLEEINDMSYSENGTDRKDYKFSITNPTSIIGYDPENANNYSMKNLLDMVWSNGDAGNFGDNVTYAIYKSQLGDQVTEGQCKFVLTDSWFHSTNYSLRCDPVDISVYRKVLYVGISESSDNEMPYTAVALTGVQGSGYVTSLKNNLSMYVKMYYNATYYGSEWVDIRKEPDITSYANSDYSRRWTVNIVGDDPATIMEGDIVKISLTFSETFFEDDDSITNDFTTGEFLIRVYAKSNTSDPNNPIRDAFVKDKTTTDFVYDGSSISNFADLKSANKSYYVTDAKYGDAGYTGAYEGQFDVVSMDVVLGKKNSNNFTFETILFEDSSSKLLLGFKGGDTYGYYAKLVVGGNNYSSALFQNYTYLDGSGTERTRNVLYDVNMFDGRKHTVVAYVDKVGYIEGQATSTSITNGYRMKHYYTVKLEIDNKFVYTLSYEGGYVDVTNTGSGNTYAYTDYVNFAHDGKVGIVLNESTAYLYRMTLKNMGVALTNNGNIVDVRFAPYESDAVLYAEKDVDVADIIDYYVVNSNDGYDGVVTYDISCKDAITGAVVKETVINELTGEERQVPTTILRNNGLYLVTVSIKVDTVQVLGSKQLYVNVIDLAESVTTLNDSIDGDITIHADAPITLEGGEGRSAFLSSMATSIDYTRLVFDFADDWTQEYKSYTTILLKVSDPSKVDLSTPASDPSYTGIAIVIRQTGTEQSPSYDTVIMARQGEFFWKSTYTGVNWAGQQNILTARYDYDNGVIDIKLVRGGTVLFNKKIRKGTLTQMGSAIGSGNVQAIIGKTKTTYSGTQISKEGYSGIQLSCANMTIHEFTVTEPQTGAYELVDNTGELVDQESFTGTVFVSDSHGIPTPTAKNTLYLTFSATADANNDSVYILFANNTPYFAKENFDLDTFTAERGVVLSITPIIVNNVVTNCVVNMFVYKYQYEFRRQEITNYNLLDGNEHTIIIRINDITDPPYTSSDDPSGTLEFYGINVEGRIIDIYLDDVENVYAGFVPYYNDLSGAMTLSSGSGFDDELNREMTDDYFISETHYVGFVGNNIDISIKELMLF